MCTKATDKESNSPHLGVDWLAGQNLPVSALICGSAPCLLEDYKTAVSHMIDAAVLVINEAGSVIRGQHLMTQHPEKADWFRQRSVNQKIVVHTAKNRERAKQANVDVYWPDCVTLATSGGSAIAIALQMGFERIVLCGMPMNGGDGYFAGSALHRDEPRFGLEQADSEYIRSYQQRLVSFAESEPQSFERVRSCSGFTRELFGAPGW